MTDLTVVILTKNEEKNLRKCVESLRGVAKRFVIVHSFSTDSTEALCKELNAELQKIGSRLDFYQNKWVSYADQLNWGLQNTDIDTEWSMRMDADEEIMEDLAAEINEKLPQIKTPVNGVILRRRVYFMGRWIKHGGRYPELLLRIFRTGMASCEMKNQMIMARSLPVEVTNGTLEGDIAPGDITFYRLQSTSDNKLRAYVAQGEVLPVATRSFGSIGVFAIHEMGRFYRHVLIEKNYPHHGAVAFGHYGKALFEVFKYIGVPMEDINYNQPASLPYPTENPFA